MLVTANRCLSQLVNACHISQVLVIASKCLSHLAGACHISHVLVIDSRYLSKVTGVCSSEQVLVSISFLFLKSALMTLSYILKVRELSGLVDADSGVHIITRPA